MLFVALDILLADEKRVRQHKSSEVIVGITLIYRCFSSASLCRVCVLNDLFVIPARRRTLVACRLVACGVAFAARDGAIRLELATQFTSAPTRRLYESLGFVPEPEFTHLSLAIPVTAALAMGAA